MALRTKSPARNLPQRPQVSRPHIPARGGQAGRGPRHLAGEALPDLHELRFLQDRQLLAEHGVADLDGVPKVLEVQ